MASSARGWNDGSVLRQRPEVARESRFVEPGTHHVRRRPLEVGLGSAAKEERAKSAQLREAHDAVPVGSCGEATCGEVLEQQRLAREDEDPVVSGAHLRW